MVVEIFAFMTLRKRALFVHNFYDIFSHYECISEAKGLFWEKTVRRLYYIYSIRSWPSAHDKHTRPYKSSYGHLTKKLISHALQIKIYYKISLPLI